MNLRRISTIVLRNYSFRFSWLIGDSQISKEAKLKIIWIVVWVVKGRRGRRIIIRRRFWGWAVLVAVSSCCSSSICRKVPNPNKFQSGNSTKILKTNAARLAAVNWGVVLIRVLFCNNRRCSNRSHKMISATSKNN